MTAPVRLRRWLSRRCQLSPRRRERDRGSVLALVPAGFLILMVLGAIAVDSGAVYLGQRDWSATLEAAANDAAGAAVSNPAFYSRGTIELDPGRVAEVVCEDVAVQGTDGLVDPTVSVAVVGPAVFVEGHADVRAVFGRSIPGVSLRPVSARAVAVASGAGTPPAPPPPARYTPLGCRVG